MRKVTIVTATLLKIVQENREKHIADHAEAVEDYKAMVIKLAQANLRLARTGDLKKIDEIKHIPPAPVSYAADYDRAIRMLELSSEDHTEIEEDIFNQLVLDEWVWKRNFLASNMAYKSAR